MVSSTASVTSIGSSFIQTRPGVVKSTQVHSEDYQINAVECTSGRVVWYIDGQQGQQVSEMMNNETNFDELYVMLNLAMGENWTNFPSNSSGLGRHLSCSLLHRVLKSTLFKDFGRNFGPGLHFGDPEMI